MNRKKRRKTFIVFNFLPFLFVFESPLLPCLAPPYISLRISALFPVIFFFFYWTFDFRISFLFITIIIGPTCRSLSRALFTRRVFCDILQYFEERFNYINMYRICTGWPSTDFHRFLRTFLIDRGLSRIWTFPFFFFFFVTNVYTVNGVTFF